MQQALRLVLFASALCASLAFSAVVRAEPQMNTGVTAGVGGRSRSTVWEQTVFIGGLRSDVLFGRDGPGQLGLGPYASVETVAFDDVRPGLGASLHVPFAEPFGFVASGGPLLSLGRGAAAGASGRLFIGTRSYNYHSIYVLSAGLVFGVDQTFGERADNVVSITVQLDGLILALPFVLGYQALFGGEDDASEGPRTGR